MCSPSQRSESAGWLLFVSPVFDVVSVVFVDVCVCVSVLVSVLVPVVALVSFLSMYDLSSIFSLLFVGENECHILLCFSFEWLMFVHSFL